MMRGMPGTNLTRDEAATRASLLDVTSYAVDLDLTTGDTTFASTTTIRFTCREPGAETFADLVDATIHEITLNGASLDPATAYADSRITLTGLAAENELVVRADCTYSRTGEGLHRFVDPADDRVYLYSQFEVPDARRVYTTFEQPDLKAPFTFTVTAPEPLEGGLQRADARARGRRRRARACGGSRRPSRCRRTSPRSSPASTTRSSTPTRASTATSRSATTAASRSSSTSTSRSWCKLTRQGFEFFEEAFDYPYPFGKYDQLYVPEYNMGAMENAGCVTLRDEYLPRSRQDGAFYEFRASVILHEMAHMWFGDLVTMKWWDDLWLNESFAEWACYHAAVEATEFTESWTGFTNARKNWAYRQDQLPSTHPIAADNVDLRAVEVNFDGITYAKGASVLKQLVAWVGLENFLTGLQGYFKDFEFANSEFTDLLAALEKASGRELDAWAQEWLQTAGVNTLAPEFELDADGSYASFAVRQTAAADYPTLRRHRLGIGLYDERRRPPGPADCLRDRRRGRRSPRSRELVGEKQPDLLLLNDGDLAYAKIRLDERSLATVVGGLGTLDDSLARALCWGAAWDMTRDAEMSATDFVTLVLSAHRPRDRRVRRQPDPRVRRPGGQHLLRAREPRRAAGHLGAAACATLLEQAEPGSDHQLTFARAYAAAAHSDEALATLEGLLDGSVSFDGLAIDTDLRWHLLTALARTGRADADRIAEELERDNTISGQERRRGRAGLPPDRRGEGRGVGDRDGARRRTERDAAQRGPRLPAARPGRRAGAVRREVPRRRRHHVGGEGHPARLDRPGVHLPAAAGQPGAARPGRRLAGVLLGQPRRQAVRPRGPRRRGPRPRRPGQGRPGLSRADRAFPG